MRLKITGRYNGNNINRFILGRGIKYFGGVLFNEPSESIIYKDVQIELRSIPHFEQDEGCCGVCSYTDNHINPRRFIISIDDKLDRRKCLLTVAHEMCHVRQLALSIWQFSGIDNECRWNGVIVDRDKLHYYDLPWEIDAYGRERGLVNRFEDVEKESELDENNEFKDILIKL